MSKYDFTKNGINEMYNDCVDFVFSVLESEDSSTFMNEMNIKISIADKEITIPLCAETFETLFDFIKEVEREENL